MISKCSLLFVFFSLLIGCAQAMELASFGDGWRFRRADVSAAAMPDFNDHDWETVVLPHTARVEALPAGKNAPQWQGVCWYRKTFTLPANVKEQEVFLRFDGAMNSAEIWVNGQLAGKFMGGYLPYVMDVSQWVRAGQGNVVAVRLDNRDNPLTGPKPLADLDFNLYGGLYRDAHLIIKNKLHITDAVLADKIAGGGIFVTFPSVSPAVATVRVETQVQNDDRASGAFFIKTTLCEADGKVVATAKTDSLNLGAGANGEFTREIQVSKPRLWSPNSPYLYQLQTELIESNKTVDAERTRVGIRRIEITKDGLRINGKKLFLRGCNRHQEYPYIGNAVPAAAQYREALKIKEAGFDYVRLSHYPQSPAFLDACDELGIIVLDSILGWQYFASDPAFAELKLRECRQLIRRDRNHPCVMLWEVSLNESEMPAAFIQQAKAVAHEEYPGDQCFTAGWEKGYDVFMEARQHGGCQGVTNVPCLVSEYGDWEYYAQNAGFAQDKWQDLQPAERSSRQSRGDGEVRMLQQAENFQEAHNDNLKTTALADGIWAMFDYNRGYAADLETSGVMDVFRLPKFSYWFFRSQRNPEEMVAGEKIGPVLFIANNWKSHSPLEVRVFSNCEEVALYLNGRLIGRQRPNHSRTAANLHHPPFTFKFDRFEPGTLRAVGYLQGQEVAAVEGHTPGEIERLTLQVDLSGHPFARGGKDVVFCHANLEDHNGMVVESPPLTIHFGVTGAIKLIGANPIATEAGIGTILLESDVANPGGAVFALSRLRVDNGLRILSAASSPTGKRVPTYQIRYTVDDSEPTADSPIYAEPIRGNPAVRAAIFVKDKLVLKASFKD
jgi:beta-galactosidase